MPKPPLHRPGTDPRARRFSDALFFDLQTLLIAIPLTIACVVIAVAVGATPSTIVWLVLMLAVLFAVTRQFVGWLRRAMAADPSHDDDH